MIIVTMPIQLAIKVNKQREELTSSIKVFYNIDKGVYLIRKTQNTP